ncbi:hypothetical protein Salmuc_00786 [Salipiger mucosus DSM 16094]|uniref:Uncharacterized protein n=1 Tax=Salipiger mucosus DSM 16094 TaxID=1123237 RepID=S9S6Z2_9RHOB|nr:hypothetical protein Salmuc_00786 [Salipiger mucosus DSM 16094]
MLHQGHVSLPGVGWRRHRGAARMPDPSRSGTINATVRGTVNRFLGVLPQG